MNPYILLTLLCLGIASAAPTVDHSVDAQLILLKAEGVFDKLKEKLKKAALETIAKEIDKHLHGKGESKKNQDITTAARAFNDMAIVKFLGKYELPPEPEAQKGESTTAEIPLSVDSSEEGYVTPVMRK